MTIQKKATSQTDDSIAASKGKKIITGEQVLLISIPQILTLFLSQQGAMKHRHEHECRTRHGYETWQNSKK